MQTKTAQHIEWAANERGYHVFVISEGRIQDEYHAGNCYQDSQTYLEPGTRGAVSAKQLRHYAQQTAQEWADELGIQVIKENADLIELEDLPS